MNKRFLRFRYAAIKRYGAKYWVAGDGYIEFNPNYVVSCSQDEKPLLSNGHDNPFILELSNGTKCLVWMHEYGAANGDEVLSETGEECNATVSESIYAEVKKKIRMYHI